MLRQLFFSQENCFETARLLLNQLHVNVTATTLEEELLKHPDYPSLLSISDVLQSHGIECLSFKLNPDKLAVIPTPFVAQIREGENPEVFTLVLSVADNHVTYFHRESHRWQSVDKETFLRLWQSGVALIADAEQKRDEENYITKRRAEKRLQFARWAAFLLLPVLALLSGCFDLIRFGTSAILPASFLFLTTIGTLVGGLLLWYEIDQYNPVLQHICGGSGRKVNCGAILQSDASKIWGISWSAIGFSYFAGNTLLLLFGGLFNPEVLFSVSWLNAFAVPYIIFSVYYQWRVARQWCILCLAVQVLLFLQCVIAFTGGWHLPADVNLASYLSVSFVVPFLVSFGLPFMIVSLVIPALREAKTGRRTEMELLRLKHNPQIFEALLAKQKAITEIPEGLGIALGNPDATCKIIKVCNPYCPPCARAHSPIDELVRNNPDIQVQIIFTSTNDAEDMTAAPARHLLAIQEKGDEAAIEKALDDWYLADIKDYKAFAAKYPMTGELKNQENKVDAMHNWCKKTGISFTPTFFINGNQLPDLYSVEDLKYFLLK